MDIDYMKLKSNDWGILRLTTWMGSFWCPLVLPSKAEYPNVSFGRSDMAFACAMPNSHGCSVPAGFKTRAKHCGKWHWRFRRAESQKGYFNHLHNTYPMPSWNQLFPELKPRFSQDLRERAKPTQSLTAQLKTPPRLGAAAAPRSRLSALNASSTHKNPQQRAIQHIYDYMNISYL